MSEDIKNFLKSLDIQIISEPTDKAVESYNQAKKEDKKVMCFLHLTC